MCSLPHLKSFLSGTLLSSRVRVRSVLGAFVRAGGWDGVGAIALSAHAEVSGQSLNLKTSCLLAKANLTFRWVFFFFFFLPHCAACGILVLWPRDWTRVPCIETQNLNHWTTKEIHGKDQLDGFTPLTTWVRWTGASEGLDWCSLCLRLYLFPDCRWNMRERTNSPPFFRYPLPNPTAASGVGLPPRNRGSRSLRRFFGHCV